MIQITKTEETDFEEFKEKHIQLVNDDWTTPLSTTRSATIIGTKVQLYSSINLERNK